MFHNEPLTSHYLFPNIQIQTIAIFPNPLVKTSLVHNNKPICLTLLKAGNFELYCAVCKLLLPVTSRQLTGQAGHPVQALKPLPVCCELVRILVLPSKSNELSSHSPARLSPPLATTRQTEFRGQVDDIKLLLNL